MNVNRDLKIVWWAPERCATKITAKIFSKFNFEVYDERFNTFTPLSDTYHSHKIILPDEFKDYRIICNVRNPYDKVLSFYLNFSSVGKNFVYLKNKKTELKNRIENFTLELFEYAINQKVLVNMSREVPVRDYVSKLSFNENIPQNFIRMENLVEDIGNLDFISDSKEWKSGELQEIIKENEFINRRPFKFQDLYTMNSAFRVFNYYRKHFYICGYDPFSFTTEKLENEEKIKFLHEIS